MKAKLKIKKINSNQKMKLFKTNYKRKSMINELNINPIWKIPIKSINKNRRN